MLTIRLQRRGRKNDPSFRVLILDSKRGPKSGSYLEMLGSYDARTDRVELKSDRIKHWMKEGAQVSDTVHNLLVNQGIVEGKKRNVLPKKTVAKVDLPAGEAGAPVVEAAPTAPVAETVAETPAEPVADAAPEAQPVAEAAPEAAPAAEESASVSEAETPEATEPASAEEEPAA
jgi:small subunit ribosomal protein S16